MFNWFMKLWYARIRKIDLDILWPACLEQAEDLAHAREVFSVHAFNDRAWLVLGKEELQRFINTLDWETASGD